MLQFLFKIFFGKKHMPEELIQIRIILGDKYLVNSNFAKQKKTLDSSQKFNGFFV